eukprot:g33491.t1
MGGRVPNIHLLTCYREKNMDLAGEDGDRSCSDADVLATKLESLSIAVLLSCYCHREYVPNMLLAAAMESHVQYPQFLLDIYTDLRSIAVTSDAQQQWDKGLCLRSGAPSSQGDWVVPV